MASPKQSLSPDLAEAQLRVAEGIASLNQCGLGASHACYSLCREWGIAAWASEGGRPH
jgi:hypothetical protein